MRRFLGPALLALGLLIVAAVTVLSTPGPDVPLDLGNDRPDGALALALWLRHDGYITHSSAAPWSAKRIIVLTSDLTWPRSQQQRALAWVRAGGRLVLAAQTFEPGTLAGLGLYPVPAPPVVSDIISVREPLLLRPAAARLTGDRVTVLPSSPGVSVAAAAGTVLLYLPLGRGAVWVLTAPDALDNAHIARADNRRLALNLAGSPGPFAFLTIAAPPGPPGDWLTATSWGAAVLFTILIAVLYRWLTGWRLGPPIRPIGRERPVVEYVISLAGLLRRSGRRDEVLAIYQAGLRRTITGRYGHVTAGPAELLAPVTRVSEGELLERARDIVRWEEDRRE